MIKLQKKKIYSRKKNIEEKNISQPELTRLIHHSGYEIERTQ
jgi:hypothetical protein